MEVLTVVFGAIGFLLIGWSAFLYEEEEKRIHDAIAAWWVQLDDTRVVAVSRNAAFVARIGQTIVAWVEGIFGARLLTLHAFAASICLSMSSLVLAIGMSAVDDAMEVAIFLAFAAVAGVLFYLGVTTRVPVAVDLIAAFSIAALLTYIFKQWMAALMATLAATVVFDFLVVIGVKRTARWISDTTSFVRPVLIGLLSAVLGVAMAAMTVAGYLPSSGRWDESMWMSMLVLFCGSKLFASVMLVSFALLPLTLAMHRMLWPLLNRPLYAMQRFRVFQQRKMLLYAGMLLVIPLLPRLRGPLERIRELFG